MHTPRLEDPTTGSCAIPSRHDRHEPSRLWPTHVVTDLAVIVSVAAVYFIAGKLGLRLAFLHPSVTVIWPCTGIALAAGLVLGVRVCWPGILLGAFLVNVTTAGSVATSLGIACGNTLEALLGTFLVNRFTHGRSVFERAHDVFTFVLLAALLSTTVSATIGMTSLGLGGFVPWTAYGPLWLTWWLGDAMGALLFTPLLLSWSNAPRWRWSGGQRLEVVLVLLSVALVGLIVFAGMLPTGLQHQPLEFVCLPFLVWTAFRFGQREATTAVVILAGIAIGGTLAGFGPFSRETPHVSLLLLQAFLGVTAVTTTVLAAAVSEHHQTQEALQRSERELADFFENAAVGLHWVGLDGRILRVNQAELDLLGYTREEYVGHHIGEFHVDPEVLADILQRLTNGQTLHDYEARLRCHDGSIKDALIDSNVLREAGRFVHTRCFTRDNTARKRAEAELQASLHEKEALLREIHHRVKNNLQIIISLLNLQSTRLQDPQLLALYQDSQQRIHSIALVHETLYRSDSLAHVNLAPYIQRLLTNLARSYSMDPQRLTLVTQLDDVWVSLDAAVPCGLVLHELLSNALKHAFPDGQTGEIHTALHADSGQVTLSVRDTGVGFPDGLDCQTAKSLGLQLVCALAEQLQGSITLERSRGTRFTLMFPVDCVNPERM